MKRYLLALLVLGLVLSPLSGAGAGGGGAPKTVFMYWDWWGDYVVLSFTSAGAVTIGSGTLTFYTIHGTEFYKYDSSESYKNYHHPVAGAGCLIGNTLYFNWTGSGYTDYWNGWTSYMEAVWDITTNEANGYYYVFEGEPGKPPQIRADTLTVYSSGADIEFPLP